MRVRGEVRRFLTGHPGAGVVAVSGGADSVALLRALADVRHGLLTVVHVNHQLRGAESDSDAGFVQNLAGELGLPFRLREVNVAAEADGDNLEATARRVRYAFFAEVAAEVGAEWIATGHTADDQAETVLHRLIRGTGLQGLRGIASGRAGGESQLLSSGRTPNVSEGVKLHPVADAPGSPRTNRGLTPPARRVIRPLLTVTRADVLAFLAELGQPFRDDATNADPRFTRNRIRHELLPLLKTFNPDVVSVLARLADHAAEAHAVIDEQARHLLANAELPRAGGTVILDAAALGTSAVLIRSALRLVWEREGWPMGEMGAAAWDRAVDVALGQTAAWDFPVGVTMRHTGRVVQLARRE